MRRSLSLVAAVVMSASLYAPSSRAAYPASGKLTVENGRVGWQGGFVEGTSIPAPEFCAIPDTCDRFDVEVNVGGPSFWASNGATLQIGIQWRDDDPVRNLPESDGEYNTLDLYVYDPAGQLVASSVTPVQSSAGIASTAQVVDVDGAKDVTYTVIVVPSNIASDVGYTGIAMIQLARPAVLPTGDVLPASGELLPDLVSLQPTNFRFEIGADSLAKVRSDAASCYVEETLQDGATPGAVTRCLRFDAGHANLGAGPFYLDVDLGSGEPTTYQGLPTIGGHVEQTVETVEGIEHHRDAGAYYFHIAHGHIHYKNFARYDLVVVDAPPLAPGTTVESKKSDFCMIDVDDLWFGQLGARPRTRHFPQCNALDPDKAQAGHLLQRQGIDRGWEDWYTWDLPGQYIDFTGKPDGVYEVVNTVNPTGVLAEGSAANNVAVTRIRVRGNTITCVENCPLGTTRG